MKLGRQLAYCHSLVPGICVFYWSDEAGNKYPLKIYEQKVLGLKDGFTEAYTGKYEVKASATRAALSMGNPHQIDYCFVPLQAQFIWCQYSLRVEANCMSPHRVDDVSVEETLKKFINSYANKNGLLYLAKRYTMNICSGRWLWRNQNTLETTINIVTSGGLKFEIDKVHQRRFSHDWSDFESKIMTLANEIHKGLLSPQNYCSMEVQAKLQLGMGAPIYPSQAFIDKDDSMKSSKIYQSINIDGTRTAILGSYKIGAAIQMIDDWYPDAEKPFRVGSYGVDKERTTVHRHPDTKLDLYSLLINIESIIDELEITNKSGENLPKQAHIIAACLIKGGLYQHGGSS